MRRLHHIIYVPGILDDKYRLQSVAIKFWRLYGVHGHLHEIPWSGQEKWEPKFQRLLAKIDEYTAQGRKVSLVGASAGASAVLNAFVERPDQVNGVVVLCPKINGPETVGDKTYRENPAFKESLYVLQKNLRRLTAEQKKRILMCYSPADGTIPYEGSVIPGVAERKLPALKHGRAIIYALTLGPWPILGFLKSLPV